MDTNDRLALHARCAWLEHELLAIEAALGSSMVAAGDAERLQLIASQENHLAELGAVNARLSALRGPTAAT